MSKRFSLYESDGFWAILENEANDGTTRIKSYCGVELIIDRMNELDQQIEELKVENEILKKYKTIYYLNQLQASNEDIDKFKQNELKQNINISNLLKDNTKQVCEKIIKFINELAWEDVKYDAFQSTMGEFAGSLSAVPRYAKKYFDLWREMFNEDLYQKLKELGEVYDK